MKHSDKIRKLNELLTDIENIGKRIYSLENMLKSTKPERFGGIFECYSVLNLNINNSVDTTIRMNNKVASELAKLLMQSLEDERQRMNVLESDYNSLMDEIDVPRPSSADVSDAPKPFNITKKSPIPFNYPPNSCGESVIGLFTSYDGCNDEAKIFAINSLREVSGLLPDDYVNGFVEGITKYLAHINKIK